MRVVLDTNVIVSVALTSEQEVFKVLQRPRIARNTVPLFNLRLRQIFDDAALVTITEPIAARRDQKDDKFLELAVNGRADVIVSGDADLLVLDGFRGIPIITPAAFGHAKII